MKIIKIIPSKKFGDSWCAEEAPGVAPCFPGPNGKQSAIDYAQNNRFGGSSGEIHVFDGTGEKIAEKISVTGERPFGA
jgi:hypothetical protein